MHRFLIASLAAMFLSCMLLGQAPASTPAQQQSTQKPQSAAPRIAPGSVIPVQLTKSVDAKKIRSGAEVLAKVTEDLKTTNGDVIFPKDTKVIGHVTEAQPRSKQQKESDLGIAFDHAVLKDGSEVKMPLSIQAIIAPPTANPVNDSNAGNYEQPGGMPSGGGMAQGGANNRPGGMGGNMAPLPTTAPTNNGPTDSQTTSPARPNITTKTEGVVGISNLKLTAAAPNAGEGSLVSSDKNNVKLESGTLMLLRVN